MSLFGYRTLAGLVRDSRERFSVSFGRIWPGRYDTGSQARRKGWTAYVLGVVAIGEMGVILVLVAVIWEMMPLKQYVPYLVHSAAHSDISIEVQPLRFGMAGFRAMTVTWVSDYVAKRNTIVPNAAVMQRIAAPDFGFIRLRSTEDVYTAWRNAASGFIARSIQEGRERSARIISVSSLETDHADELPPLPWTYIVDYEIVDTVSSHGEEGPTSPVTRRQAYRATLTVTFRQRGNVAATDLYDPERSNAVGFTVLKFDEVEIKT